ncbi:hypothetical protein [Xanthomonas arboricola]
MPKPKIAKRIPVSLRFPAVPPPALTRFDGEREGGAIGAIAPPIEIELIQAHRSHRVPLLPEEECECVRAGHEQMNRRIHSRRPLLFDLRGQRLRQLECVVTSSKRLCVATLARRAPRR